MIRDNFNSRERNKIKWKIQFFGIEPVRNTAVLSFTCVRSLYVKATTPPHTFKSIYIHTLHLRYYQLHISSDTSSYSHTVHTCLPIIYTPIG